jgi:hypothetical protein
MGVARLLPLLLVLATAAQARGETSLARTVGDAAVDWSTGTITVQAGAAADIRMPSANAARPGAERRARAAAEEKLKAAARVLVGGKALDDKSIPTRAVVSRVEYQSNGGVVLWLTVRFEDLVPVKTPVLALKVSAAELAFAPVLSIADRDIVVGFATYRPMSACPKEALPAWRDSRGRLVLDSSAAKQADSFAGAAVVIYLEKPLP